MENNENGVQTPNEVADTQKTSVDYEKEFKALTEKYKSLNNDYMKKSDAYDKVSSENADYKRKERDKMSDEEKRARELQELIDSKNKMEAELKQMRLEKDLLANGFTTEESDKLIKGNFSVKDIADIIKLRADAIEKSVRAEMLKDSTPKAPMGNGTTTDPKGKSDFAVFQEKKFASQNSEKVEF